MVPEARLVVVITGGNNHNERTMDILRVRNRDLAPGVDQAANTSASIASAIHPDKE